MQDIRKPYSHSKSNEMNLSHREQRHTREDSLYEEELDDREVVHIPRREKRRNIDSMDMYPRTKKASLSERDERSIDTDPYTPYRDSKHQQKHGSFGTWAFISTIVIVVAGTTLLTFFFNSATITLTPKFKDIDIHKTYTLSRTQEGGAVLYELATTTVSKSKTLPLSETKKIQAKASGKIIIYNNFDSNPQKLIKNTRFESTAGKIYRISESITVPGKKGTTPGSIEVMVYADSYGNDYNVTASDFTIPGFKGTPRYSGFFGRSNGAISGGSSGNVALVSQSDLDAAKDELALELTQEAKQAFKDSVKDGFVSVSNSVQVVITDNADSVITGQTSTYTAQATGYMMLVREGSLAQALAGDTMLDYAKAPVRLSYTDQLSFTLKNDAKIYTDQRLDVLVEGKPRIIMVTDTEQLKDSFIGKNRSDAPGIIQKVPSISQIEMSFFPLWLSSIPTNRDHISVVESLPKR